MFIKKLIKELYLKYKVLQSETSSYDAYPFGECGSLFAIL
ncbi:hypothetical protein X875_8970 [Mannheimia varigena USDA-ARS-USMARC-1388]|nr:hypothetical protein X875_8970 [Mannheimia varigena USDA-ARS-USMARC-1388]